MFIRRRLLPLLLMFLLLCGCARLAEGEYQVVTDHVETSMNPETTGRVYEVHTYSGLKRAIQDLVNTGVEDGIVRAAEYSGIVRDDVSKACLEVARSTPMGTYAVDYMTHSVTRILSYDEVSIHIQYKLSRKEIADVRSVTSLVDFFARIDEGLDSGSEYLALQVVTLSINDRTIKSHVSGYYQQHPDSLLSLPDVSVSFYPSEDYVQKIITLTLDYHTPPEDRAAMLSALRERAETITREIDHAQPEIASMLCCTAVANALTATSNRGRTAYDVLLNGSGNSEGCAMAYQLLCSMCGISCQVITGRLNSETHYWNLIQLDGDYYHVDCSACVGNSLENGFLKRDSDLWGSSWWEPGTYPSAQGSLTLSALREQLQKPDPNTIIHFDYWD